jgi:hypothetical protein
MTCIAAAVDPMGRVAIGCDTELTTTYRMSSCTKLLTWGPWRVAAAGPSLWRRFVTELAPTLAEKTPQVFADEWVSWARGRGHGGSDGNHLWLDGAWILARPGELVQVGADGALVVPAEGYVAIGSGASVAVGALYALRHEPVAKQVRAAIEAAIAHGHGCGGDAIVEVLGAQ